MYHGVKAMIEAEKALGGGGSAKPSGGSIKAGSHLKKTSDITGMLEFPEGTTSSLCRFMTKDVFNKYHGKKDKAGVSFE
jgi:hypothetical protein